MSFTNPCSPLAAIVIVHIFYINENTSPPIYDCDAVGVAFNYLGANATTSRRLATYMVSHLYGAYIYIRSMIRLQLPLPLLRRGWVKGKGKEEALQGFGFRV